MHSGKVLPKFANGTNGNAMLQNSNSLLARFVVAMQRKGAEGLTRTEFAAYEGANKDNPTFAAVALRVGESLGIIQRKQTPTNADMRRRGAYVYVAGPNVGKQKTRTADHTPKG